MLVVDLVRTSNNEEQKIADYIFERAKFLKRLRREKLQSYGHKVRAHALVEESIDERCQSHDDHRQDVNKPREKLGVMLK